MANQCCLRLTASRRWTRFLVVRIERFEPLGFLLMDQISMTFEGMTSIRLRGARDSNVTFDPLVVRIERFEPLGFLLMDQISMTFEGMTSIRLRGARDSKVMFDPLGAD